MANPITQADVGGSLARIYDTQGQQSGGPNAELEADRILLVHEMGHVIASEQFVVRVRRIDSGATAQSSNFDAVIDDLPKGPYRILGLQVSIDAGSVSTDVVRASVLQRDPSTGREVPIWTYTAGTLVTVRADIGAGVTQVLYLVPAATDERFTPGWRTGMGSNREISGGSVSALALRGTTGAFGAGTRTLLCDVLIGLFLPSVGSIQDGLPIPSW